MSGKLNGSIPYYQRNNYFIYPLTEQKFRPNIRWLGLAFYNYRLLDGDIALN